MSRDELKNLWPEHLGEPFPGREDVDLAADLAEYDGHIAGIISTTVAGGRSRFASQLEVDDALPRRVGDTGDAAAISYVRRLSEMARLVRNRERSTESER